MNVAIIGPTGYVGIELLRLLYKHPHVNIHSIHSSSKVDTPLHEYFPHVHGMLSLQLEEIDVEKIAKACDVVFFATPSGIAKELALPFIDKGIRIIDLSGDFRLQEEGMYEQWYKNQPAPMSYVQQAVYGLSEWNKENIRDANVLSNPGCYATAALLGLAPLLVHGVIEEDSIVIDAKSGVSGAGKSPTMMTHFPETNENIKIYRMNEHQHIPEIEQQLAKWNKNVAPITFSTHLLPVTRGIMATMYGKVKKEESIERLINLYKECYQDCSFVRIQEKGIYPSIKQVYGSNCCDIGIAYDERTSRVTIVSVIDNVMKGAAGQAVQNFNIMYGLDERTGLDFLPIFP
ncbi:N-acetyl-gamma-glutamyl-phosphate reductase [Priestia taiwanensis]|uniref:N-acetyl-gamma-glutamyl-phosphate reductase n=1 Tax=Priestia taiwanensis TaxID=1347902 RepID=A0A917EQQ7_9BACI|nr:N-acetyl-gamma-glutamyl-phosphate reductase [Priestia taiwanensis]MBM7363511.1 N-acetyl-gamma-glutamyl-phosphate reductase [Priestia taiwanensis]GGE76516.1 N-acetyl-gamma-glutamyl-phosphate reductase [Priestia taiwanensis]